MDKTILRTPDHCFNDLPDFDFAPHYASVSDERFGALRMHYIDEGPRDGPVILMLHGEPTWSFLYRKLIPPMVVAGCRVVVPDHIGFGRSDKLPERSNYSYQRYVDWMLEFLDHLELTDITLLCQDWGGPIGLRVLATIPDQFAAVMVTNTLLPNCQPPPRGVEGWPGDTIEDWVMATACADDLPVGDIVASTCIRAIPDEVKHAYDAPFPDASYKAAVLEFPSLIPIKGSMDGVKENCRAWDVLEQWHKPFMTAFSSADPTTKAWEIVFQRRVPGAKLQDHVEIAGAGHFVQEDQGESLASALLNFIGRAELK